MATKDNPDNTFVYTSTFVLALFIAITILVCFTLFATPNRIFEGTFFKVFWVVIPLLAYLLSAAISMTGQHILCGKVDFGAAFQTSLSTLVLILAFLFVPYKFPVARMPVSSLFINNPSADTHAEENSRPVVMGASFAYYAFWGVLFGQITASSLSAACPGV